MNNRKISGKGETKVFSSAPGIFLAVKKEDGEAAFPIDAYSANIFFLKHTYR